MKQRTPGDGEWMTDRIWHVRELTEADKSRATWFRTRTGLSPRQQAGMEVENHGFWQETGKADGK